MDDAITLRWLLKRFRREALTTWALVLLANLLLALIPLSISWAIDGLLEDRYRPVLLAGSVLVGATLLGVLQRVYDTRAYGTMRVHIGSEVASRHADLPVSQLNARVDMSRELVDFLEGHVPLLVTSVVQLVVSIAILLSFHWSLGLAALATLALMLAVYRAFDSSFFEGNQQLNEQVERQVSVLEARQPTKLREHLLALRAAEVRLSDTEAWVYGTLFVLASAFVLGNLVLSANYVAVTIGSMFAIVSYSWEFVESALGLPTTFQMLSRLSEIKQRLNPPAV